MLQVVVNVFLESFSICRKEACRYIKRKSIEKIDKCPRYLKQWVLRYPP
jgi:hypothetical protein